jgi:hypothetical protein
MLFVRDDARVGEGFGLHLAPDAPFLSFGPLGFVFSADAPCWAAPAFFELRAMMELWSVRVLDSKNKSMRFAQPFFAIKNFAPVPTGKNTLYGFKSILKPRHPDQKLDRRLFVPPVSRRKMRLSTQQAVTSRP